MNPPARLHVGFAPYDLRFTFWAILSHALQTRARELDVQISTVPITAGRQTRAVLEEFLRRQVDAIICVPPSDDQLAILALARQALQRGVPVITLDSPFPEGAQTCVVRSDNAAGAELAAERLLAQLEGRARLVHLHGPPTTHTGALRAQAVRAVIARHPAAEIVFEAPAGWSRAEGARLMRLALAADRDVQGLVASNDQVALGAIDALEEFGLAGRVAVAGFDADAEALRALASGALTLTVQQQPARLGRAALDMALRALAGAPTPAEVVTDVTIVGAENMMSALLETVDLLPGALQNQIDSAAEQQQIQQETIDAQERLIRDLAESEARFAQIFLLSPIATALVDSPGGRIIDVNDSYLRLMHLPRERLIGSALLEGDVWSDPAERERVLELVREQRPLRDIEVNFRIGTGDVRTTLVSIIHIELNEAPCMLAMLHDITDRKRTEAALREREEHYRLITENATDLIAILDQEGRFVYVSPSHHQCLNRDPAALLGARAVELVHPDDLQALARATEELRRAGSAQLTFRCAHADGSWRWLDASGTPMRRGASRHVLIVSRDITERRLLEAQLFQAQRMESIGRLAGGVAHDFNNLLTAIGGYADLVRASLPADHEASEDLGEIRLATDRAARLTRQLLAFARKQIITPHLVSLNALIGDLNRLLQRVIGEHIELRTRLAPDLWPVQVDPGQIEQVLLNLAVNSRDAMPDGGRLVIETQNTTLDTAYARQHVSVVPGPYVLLAVSDTGTGMTPDVLAHVFEPFFTTKEVGRGTGLGLATCYGIVKQHGGNIWVYSEPGYGTTFKVYLPRAEGPPDMPEAAAAAPAVRGGRETVLLVEDDAAVRELAARLLRGQGYTVLEAADGPAALRIADAHAGAIQLLVTDVVMPQIGGQALAARLAARMPHLRVLFMSGYTDGSLVWGDLAQQGGPMLQKPFTPAALLERVRDVLDA